MREASQTKHRARLRRSAADDDVGNNNAAHDDDDDDDDEWEDIDDVNNVSADGDASVVRTDDAIATAAIASVVNSPPHAAATAVSC